MSNSNRTLSMVKIVDLRKSIDNLMLSESNSVAIVALCEEYKGLLNSGKHDEEICEKFVIELSKIAESEKSKKILSDLNESVKKNSKNIEIAKSVYGLYNGVCKYVAPVIESFVVDYIIDKNAETRASLCESISLFANEPLVKNIMDIAVFEGHAESLGVSSVNAILLESNKEPEKKTYTEDEVDAIIADRIAEANEKKTEVRKTISSIDSHIGLHGVITSILEKNGNNEKLRAFCEQYMSALNAGKPEETLYESFISGISNWNYLSAVDTELSALGDRIGKYKQDIDLKKVLKIMEQTASYFIVPLIEEVVVDYINDKSMAKRALLLQRLESFEYDPFVRDIINIVNKDQSLNAGVYLGESVSLANKYVHVENVFSPVKYIRENECVFNVKGIYYRRVGSEISKLSRQEVNVLSESFKNLCNIVNSGDVKISEELNTISVYCGNNKAVISESEITVNGKKTTPSEIDALMNQAVYFGEDTQSFYSMVKILNENFDNIAPIDFVKRISSNDRSGKSVDVFKIDESIFVNTIDESLGRSVYYKNVNPIQCRNYINEHMGINVSSLFEDVLPDQDKIEEEISTKKAEFENYIESLEKKKEELIKMKDESSNVDDIDDVIDSIDKEIDAAKDDYKQYQKDADDFLNGKDSDKEDSLKDEVHTEEPEDSEKSDDKEDDSDKKEPETDSDEKEPETDSDEKDGEEKESPEEMEQPITGDAGSDIPSEDDMTGEEPDEYADVPDFDSDFDAPAPTYDNSSINADDLTNGHGSGVVPSPVNSYQVVRVSYNKNVKTGKVTNKGEVIVVIPSVDANGDVHDDMRKVTFYLDANKKPVINNEYMPLDMYYSICDAIENTPEMSNGSFDDDDNTPVGGPASTPETPVDGPDVDNDNIPDLDFGDEGSTDTSSVDSTSQDSIDSSIGAVDASIDINVNETPSDSSTSIEPVDRQTPAEVQQADSEAPQYPITIGLYHDEFAPRSVEDFEKDLDDMKIEHNQTEGVSDEICLKINNKAQAHALRNYFKDWMNYSNEEFDAFCPELIKCFQNKQTAFPVGPTNEGLTIKGIKAISESFKKEGFSALVPGNKEYCNLLGIDYDKRFEARPSMMRVIAESVEDAQYIYNKLYLHSLKNKNIEQDVVDILEHYAPQYKENAEKSVKYNLSVPYNGFLESKLESLGFDVEHVDESMNTVIFEDQFKRAKKILESFYGKSAPTGARDFFNRVDEGVHITIKDDATGKTVEINTDDLDNKMKGDDSDGEGADYESSFKGTTFDMKDSMVFHDDEDSSDDSDEEKDDKKEDKGDKKEKESTKKDESLDVTESETGSDEDEEKEDKEEKKESSKKKFKFKSSKKSNESVNEKSSNILNESAKPTVLDMVSTPSGKGQIIFELADGTFIVNVSGHTLNFNRNQVKMIKDRPDTVDFPWKLDPATLKVLVESYVGCGMFINGARITSDDCRVSLNEYNSAKENDEINVMLEGQSTKVLKKYIKLTENIYETLNIANYAKGKVRLALEEGIVDADAYINLSDFNTYKNINESLYPVRSIVKLGDEAKMVYVSGDSISMMTDYQK